MLVRILMKDLSFSWPLQNPQNSEMLLQPYCSEALAGQWEDENGSKRHKLLWVPKVLGKTATPKQQWWKSETNFYGKQPFHSFFKQSLETYNGCLPLHSIPWTSLWTNFCCISLVPSNSFKTVLFLAVVLAVCNKTCCVALLPFPQWHENSRLSRYGSVFALLLPQINSPQKNKRWPYLHSAACRNARNFVHNEVQGLTTLCMLGVKVRLVGTTRVAMQSRTLLCTAPERRRWVWFLRDGLQPGLGWMASGHPNWKWVCCRGAQKLKAAGQAVIHIDSCCATLAYSPWWDGKDWDTSGCCADKSRKRARTDCARGHFTIISIYPTQF